MEATLLQHGIMHVLFESRKDQTLALHRISEYFESPDPALREQFFTEETFLSNLMHDDGSVPYFSLYEGFNFPRETLTGFSRCFNSRMSPREQRFHRLITTWEWQNHTRLRYIITSDLASSSTTFQHELAHAFWHCSSEYKQKALDLLQAIPGNLLSLLIEALLQYDYSCAVIDDELQAYLGSDSDEELAQTFPGIPLPTLLVLAQPFRNLQETTL